MPRSTTKRRAPAALAAESATADAGADPGALRRGRGRPRVADAAELEAELFAAARQAFTTLGYGATSMAALARTARISKTTLYAKFPTKAALFRAIIELQLDRAYGAVEDAASHEPKTLASSLHHLAEETLKQALEPENVSLNRLVEWEAPRFPELAEVARSRVRIGIGHIAGYIREFAAQDGVPCRDPEAAAELFNFMVRGLYHDACVGARPAGPDELRRVIDKVVTAFLASRPTW